jgi:hypothetical protein
MSATALSSNEEAEARQFWRFILILCVVYAVLLLCTQYLDNLWIERERARFFDLG